MNPSWFTQPPWGSRDPSSGAGAVGFLEQQPEQLVRAVPVIGGGVAHLRVDDPQRPGKREADAAEHLEEDVLGLRTEGHITGGRRNVSPSSRRSTSASSRLLNARICSCRPFVIGRSCGAITSRPFHRAESRPAIAMSSTCSSTKFQYLVTSSLSTSPAARKNLL